MAALFFAWQRDILEAGDVARLRAAWKQMAAHLPQPKDDAEAEIMLHHARTQCEFVTFPKRAYSHRWLTERNLPSGLPDNLKPKAERLYPKVVTAVGISINMRNPYLQPAAVIIRGAMERKVEELYADGVQDPAIVKPEIMRAREDETRRLFGALNFGGVRGQ